MKLPNIKFDHSAFGGGSGKINTPMLKTIVSILVLIFTAGAIYFASVLLIEDHDSTKEVIEIIIALFSSIFALILFLSYLFKSKKLAKILSILFTLVIPVIIYFGFWEGALVEKSAIETILKKTIPEFISYSIYIVIIAGIIFELAVRLLGKKFASIRVKVKENPYKIRAYFLIIILFLATFIESLALSGWFTTSLNAIVIIVIFLILTLLKK